MFTRFAQRPGPLYRQQPSKMPKGGKKKTRSSELLPISKYRRKLVEAIQGNTFVVVTGETGSGKTTQLPKYLFEEGFARHGTIAVTQPRRMAAITVAERVAEELGCPLGSTVGYQVRFEECISGETAIKYLTDGCLLRQILADPHLTQYSVVVLDEAHERSLCTDILFGLLKQLLHQEKDIKRKEPLKVVVMSATLDVEKFSAFFGCCSVVEIPGREYLVEQIFCDGLGPRDVNSSAYITETVKVTLDVHLNGSAGDILVFLTGQSEIERARELLFRKAEMIDYRFDVRDRSVEGLLILPLYGCMPTDQQRRIFLPPPPGIRKCVVSTNIAATSLTIDGIKYVVDSGFVKQLNHNPRVGLDVLEVVPISKSEALQRAGRAGRTASGKCFRVYNKEFWEQCMPDHMVPEIERTSLTSVMLTLKCLAIHNVIRFPYLDHPEEKRILAALKQLYQCGAIDRKGHVTRLGQFMVWLPLPPHLSCAVLKAAFLGCDDLLLPIAAMLSVEKVFIHPGDPQKQKGAELRHQNLALQMGGCSDFTTLLSIFEQCRASTSPSVWCQENWVHWRAVKLAFSVERQLREIINRLKQLHDQEDQLDWILFHDVVVTSKIYLRTVCPIRYAWVQDLLPRLHQIDAYELSSMARENVTEEEMAKWRTREDLGRQNEKAPGEPANKMEKRNDEQSIRDARARYLERKQERMQGSTPSSKDSG
ncbi:probable ATP-dependent RNA helicase DHX40 isoform X2 [Candoia aspera]|uniref:probable ATP-dependent RNA helicase DHX40 isoform X2 n=1 Tax=Candoia aspera TaxID=51853 RepID=UPI002FD7CBEA